MLGLIAGDLKPDDLAVSVREDQARYTAQSPGTGEGALDCQVVRMLLKRMRADDQVKKQGSKYIPSLSMSYRVTERESI